ncbi:MAG: SHOCT domain-containing protein [Candidatus Cloacimonetes bacterium]|nr:SHOCT domain-containing protein [Candidatus Cloacimonadota bacterium]
MNAHYLKPIVTGIFLFFFSMVIYADIEKEDDHNISIDKVLEGIRLYQNVDSNELIDPEKISDERLENLGKAAVSQLYPAADKHEFMKDMMGDEDSVHLSKMYKWMGYRYIKSGFNLNETQEMLDSWMQGSGPMMDADGHYMRHGGTKWPVGSVHLLFVFALIILVIILSIYNTLKHRTLPLEILKRRLAKGEISSEEFEDLKQKIIE